MKHDGKLKTCPFRGPLFIKKKYTRENLLQINHKNGSSPKTSTRTQIHYTLVHPYPHFNVTKLGNATNEKLAEKPEAE